MHIEYSLGSTTYRDTKQASANLRGQKLFQASILTHNTMNWKSTTEREMRKNDYMEIKQHTTKWVNNEIKEGILKVP